MSEFKWLRTITREHFLPIDKQIKIFKKILGNYRGRLVFKDFKNWNDLVLITTMLKIILPKYCIGGVTPFVEIKDDYLTKFLIVEILK